MAKNALLDRLNGVAGGVGWGTHHPAVRQAVPIKRPLFQRVR